MKYKFIKRAVAFITTMVVGILIVMPASFLCLTVIAQEPMLYVVKTENNNPNVNISVSNIIITKDTSTSDDYLVKMDINIERGANYAWLGTECFHAEVYTSNEENGTYSKNTSASASGFGSSTITFYFLRPFSYEYIYIDMGYGYGSNTNDIADNFVACTRVYLSSSDIILSGTCGDYTTFELNTAGNLSISGNGKIGDFQDAYYNVCPWANQRDLIKSVTISKGINEIGDKAFRYLDNVNEFDLPEGLTTIGQEAFLECSSLSKISIPNSVNTIEKWAFNYCSKLKSVVLPNNLTYLDDIFYNTDLESITIPVSVTSIWDTCFRSCTDLTIYGYAGSYAETYAKNKNIRFVALNDTVLVAPNDPVKQFINQHYFASVPRYWNKYHEVSDTMAFYDDNLNTEISHSMVIALNGAVNIITVDINGVIQQISSNAYNAILLDMYYDLEMNNDELIQFIYEDSLHKSINKVMNPMLGFIGKTATAGNHALNLNRLTLEDDLEKWFNGQYPEYTFIDLMEKNGLSLSSNSDRSALIEELKYMGMTSEELGEIGDIVSGITTVNDYMDNMKNIICASTLKDMNETYRQILIDIRDKAENISGHDWEKKDLINALNYEIYYRENYGANITWESIKATYEAVSSTKEFKKIKNELWEKPAEELIKSTFQNSAAILAKLNAVQLGTGIGWTISDSIFNLTDSTDLYYKGKAYGVLEEIIIDILNETAPKLELYEETDTSTEIQYKYKVAEKFDYAFRMYIFVEANGCKTYSEYEKSFLPNEDNWLKAFAHHIGNTVELIVRLTFGDLSVLFGDIEKAEQLRNYNALYYQRRENFIKENLKCHGGEFNTLESCKAYFSNVSDKYLEMLDEDVKAVAVLCPVEVEVYDENGALVGTISSVQNTIENNANVFAYRNDELDANIIVCDSDYSIKIIGIGTGTMKVFGSCYNGTDIVNGVGYANIPIDKDYVADFDVTPTGETLKDNNSKLSAIKINDSELAEFETYTTTYNYLLNENTTKIPTVTATQSNSNATVSIQQATSLTDRKEERTATITVTAEDGVTQTIYTVEFVIASGTPPINYPTKYPIAVDKNKADEDNDKEFYEDVSSAAGIEVENEAIDINAQTPNVYWIPITAVVLRLFSFVKGQANNN